MFGSAAKLKSFISLLCKIVINKKNDISREDKFFYLTCLVCSASIISAIFFCLALYSSSVTHLSS